MADGPVAGLPDLAADPTLREIVRLARSYGTSPSRFMGRPALTTTTYQHAPDGRVLASTTEADPDWTEHDRALAMALADYERDACPGCGYSMAETTAPEAEERFVPGQPIRCHRCTAAAQAAQIHKTDYHPTAVFYGVRDRNATTGDPDHATDLDTPGE